MVDPITLSLGLFAAVTSAITAYKDGRSMYSKWKKKRAAKRQRSCDTSELETALVACSSDVQNEYDRMLMLAGPEFARGDRENKPGTLETDQKELTSLTRKYDKGNLRIGF